jgi:hypothetical protein
LAFSVITFVSPQIGQTFWTGTLQETHTHVATLF